MRYDWLDTYILKKPGVTKDLQKEWNWVRYHIEGKMFVAVCLNEKDDEPYFITLKLEPEEGDFLRKQYEDIIPGYYMNKKHWNSIQPDGEVPDDLLRDLLDKSYDLVLSSFSKKRQREILGLSCCGTVCSDCGFYGKECQGCNESLGKVFHAPEGKSCPIYSCSVKGRKLRNCSQCKELPCEIWRSTKDPRMSEEAFEKNIADRINALKLHSI